MDIESILREVATPAPDRHAPAKPLRRVPGTEARDWTLPGFGPLTRITTSFGDVPAQALRKGDLVRTRNGDFRQIEWLDRIVLDEEFLSFHPDALPVHIRVGALGRGLPAQDLYLSPNQPIDAAASHIAGRPQLVRDLIGRPGVFRKAEAMYTYTLFHCGEAVVVQAGRMCLPVEP